jgi:phosphatidate cytidylyltransferase
MSFRKRLPTALILLGLLFLVIQWTSRLVFFLFLQIFIIVALLEFYGLVRRKKMFPQRTVGILLALLISASFFLEVLPFEMALFLGLLLAGLYYVITINTIEKVALFPFSFAATIFGPLYISFTMNYLYLLRLEKGPFYIYFLFAVIFLGDSGAYWIGSLLGRHKMTPWASPNKTWEGSVGGLVLACLGAMAVQQLLLKEVSIWAAVLAGFFVHAVAQLSDPLESLFKRAAGVKDSSNLLPGHGGFLDRIDSLILAAPFFYYFIRFFWK